MTCQWLLCPACICGAEAYKVELVSQDTLQPQCLHPWSKVQCRACPRNGMHTAAAPQAAKHAGKFMLACQPR
jgi:hypothetical protein